jgi:hypothetical protein
MAGGHRARTPVPFKAVCKKMKDTRIFGSNCRERLPMLYWKGSGEMAWGGRLRLRHLFAAFRAQLERETVS